MALGIVNLALIEQTSMFPVISSSSSETLCRNAGTAAALIFSSSINRKYSYRVNRLFVTSPFVTRALPVKVLLAEKSSCILGGQGYFHARSRKVLAGSHADMPAASEISEAIDEDEITEVQLSGDDTEVQEIGETLYSVRTLRNIVFKIGHGSKQFVTNTVGGVVGIFKKEEKQRPELIAFEASHYESKDGKTALSQWTATELTMQHSQLVRIATDLNYLVFAFAFFGWVRVLEAVLAAFSTHPSKLRKLTQVSNALDPLTVAWLAYNLRKPILGILQVNPTDFQKLAELKGKLWEELHAFFERQWKVMATLAVVRFLGLVTNNVPASQWVAGKVKALWDVTMMLPIF